MSQVRARSIRRRATVPLLAILVVLAPHPAGATFPGDNGVIAFGNGYGEVWAIAPDGSEPHRLTRGVDGAFSADGRTLAVSRFFSEAGSFDSEIFLVDVESGEATQLTDHRRFESFAPAWSPDATAVVFVRCCDETNDLYIKEVAGGLRQLTDAEHDFGRRGRFTYNPAWSPDGTSIVFEVCCYGRTRNRDLVTRLYVVAPDGTGVRRLAATDGYSHYDASFSPDGSTVAFATCCYSSRRDLSRIFTIDIDGVDLTRLTQASDLADEEPAYSPDGAMIAFTRCCLADQEGPDIFVMNADGSQVERLTATQDEEFVVDWQALPSP